jgi:hypothetical protein
MLKLTDESKPGTGEQNFSPPFLLRIAKLSAEGLPEDILNIKEI